MNTQRDELAEMTAGADTLAWDIFRADNSKAPTEELQQDFPARAEYAIHIAKGLRDLGYSKPRVIETTEELDTLPVGSVVLHNGRAFQHYPSHAAPFDEYQKWKCADGGFVRSTKDGSSILPATVLYEAAS